jgi:hypothetical protein
MLEMSQLEMLLWRNVVVANLKSLSSAQLLAQTESAVRCERESTAVVIRHFQEISNRKLYLDRGFSSLFEMATKHFGYCAASAMRRINSMKLIRDLPEVEAKIETGELSLTAAANVQSFFQAEAKERKGLSFASKIELVDACLGKSTREVEKELSRRSPTNDKRESIRHTAEDRLRLSCSISEELYEKLEHLKNLMSHADAKMSTENLLSRLAEIALDRLDPFRKAERARKRNVAGQTDAVRQPQTIDDSKEEPHQLFTEALPAQETVSLKRSRYVTAENTRDVWAKNDSNGCEFVDETTGRRCGSKHLLQKDHVDLFSHGGSNDAANLRILCAQHNQWRWRNGQGSRVESSR